MGCWQSTRQTCDSSCMLQVVTTALPLHPREPSPWVYAAAWEFEHNRNAAASRTLMQRGLRMCPGSAELWAEYFRMELLYAHTLCKRREILGIATSGEMLQPKPLHLCTHIYIIHREENAPTQAPAV